MLSMLVENVRMLRKISNTVSASTKLVKQSIKNAPFTEDVDIKLYQACAYQDEKIRFLKFKNKFIKEPVKNDTA